eukprot:TRINITY_DN6666_c1_g1_i1.p3 TRINITY_DN6666_c1_g1~~TRINITY_DN6666_c1_g1_i1.p3  ORF type:complete len:104 (+),score=14.56 TRINITY_DN6666_c1_g1_i1:610-921(+)
MPHNPISSYLVHDCMISKYVYRLATITPEFLQVLLHTQEPLHDNDELGIEKGGELPGSRYDLEPLHVIRSFASHGAGFDHGAQLNPRLNSTICHEQRQKYRPG